MHLRTGENTFAFWFSVSGLSFQVNCGFAKKQLRECMQPALKNACRHVPFDSGPLSEVLQNIENAARRVRALIALPSYAEKERESTSS